MSETDSFGLEYMRGFGNYFTSEHSNYPNSLPINQNNPQKCAYNLFAEHISGTSFTAPKKTNFRSYMYRKYPSVVHKPFEAVTKKHFPAFFAKDFTNNFNEITPNPNQMRWKPFDFSSLSIDDIDNTTTFINGLSTVCGVGQPEMRYGVAIHVYLANKDMGRQAMCNSDGDMMILPQQGSIDVRTEMGRLIVSPGEMAVIPQGIRFQICIIKKADNQNFARGYVLEIWGSHFQLPELGPIGANGLAYERHFLAPVAWTEDNEPTQSNPDDNTFYIINKFQGNFFVAKQPHTCFNVVAWHGNYTPFKYDLRRFQVINSVSFDHCDPSIFTVLTAPGIHAGTALADFVIFPPRWSVSENTFRPPYFHRNCMSEFMGLLYGNYEAKGKDGFQPGGASLHLTMTPHGPDSGCFSKASEAELNPERIAEGTMAFMFESSLGLRVTDWAIKQNSGLDLDYHKCWENLGRKN